MATEEINITLFGKSHRLTADSSKRELYHLAEQQLNAAIVKLERRNYVGLRPQDVVALAAFEFVVSNIRLRQQNEVDSEEMVALKAIDKRIEEYMVGLGVDK